MLLIRATPSSGGRSDQSDGTPARIVQRNYGSAPLHYGSFRLQDGLSPAGGPAAETPPVAPALAWVDCRTPHRLAPAVSLADPLRERGPLLQEAAQRALATRPPFGSHHWHSLRSLLPLAAWPAHHTLGVTPSHTCRGPQGSGRSARPFFCWLL